MIPLVKYISDFGGNIVSSIGDTLDKFITTKEEKAKALEEIQTEINRHIEQLTVLADKDKEDARNREVQTVTSEHTPLLNKIILPILAIIVMLGGGFIYYRYPENRSDVSQLMMLVLAYYFGSSLSSKNKQDYIESMRGK